MNSPEHSAAGREASQLASDAQDTLRKATDAAVELATALGLDEVASNVAEDGRRRLVQQRLRVVILGEIKHGKSSLLNALVGSAVLPVGVTPTTAAVVRVASGEESGRFLVSGGTRTAVEPERFADLVRGKEPETTGGASLEVVTDAGVLPQEIELVDTPGLNDVDRLRGALTRGELPRADVLVLVLDATQALTRTELALLRDAVNAVGGLKGSGAALEIVINRIDLVAESDRQLVVDHLRKQLGELFPGAGDTTPFLTDARTALAQPDSDTDAVRDVARLRARLAEHASQRESVLPARMRASLLQHLQVLGYSLQVQTRAVALAREEAEAEARAVREALDEHTLDLAALKLQIRAGADEVRARSRARTAEFRDRLVADAKTQIRGADLRILTDVLPGALQDAFLEFTRQEASTLREELDTLSREVLRTHGDLARRHLARATLHLGFAGPGVYVEPPSLAIEAGLLVLGVVGTAVMYFGNVVTGMLMTIASPLATMMLREKSVRDARKQAFELVPGACEGASARLDEVTASATTKYADALDEHLTLASAAIGRQLASALEGAQARVDAAERELPPEAATTQPKDTDGGKDTDGDKATNSGEPAAGDEGPTAQRPEEPAEGADDPGEPDRETEDPAVRRRRRAQRAATQGLRRLEERLVELRVLVEGVAVPGAPPQG